MLSRPFAAILKSGRMEFNRRFQEAKHAFPELSTDAFRRFLEMSADPLVVAMDGVDPSRAAQTAGAAFDAGLELVGQKLAGSGGNHIEEGWRGILVPAARLVAEAPVRAIAAVSNALHHLAAAGPGARPGQWIAEMAGIAPACPDLRTLLAIGQIAAWRAGLAHYRESALDAAQHLAPALALRAVCAPAGADWDRVRARLLLEPWYDPAAPEAQSPPRIAARAGAFRGFGGLFSQPPVVAASSGHIFVRSAAECWLLTADAFGATFHRADPSAFEQQVKNPLPAGVRIRKDSVTCNGGSLRLPHAMSSAAANDHTLAVTSALSHQVTLIALR